MVGSMASVLDCGIVDEEVRVEVLHKSRQGGPQVYNLQSVKSWAGGMAMATTHAEPSAAGRISLSGSCQCRCICIWNTTRHFAFPDS